MRYLGSLTHGDCCLDVSVPERLLWKVVEAPGSKRFRATVAETRRASAAGPGSEAIDDRALKEARGREASPLQVAIGGPEPVVTHLPDAGPFSSDETREEHHPI